MVRGICLGNVMVDCMDAEALCAFYHGLLGWERRVLYGNPALRSGEGIVLLFCGDAGYVPPAWPEEEGMPQKQMHFDFQVPDVAAAVEIARSLGARVADSQFGGAAFVTMIDPAGHPFCLCDQGNPA